MTRAFIAHDGRGYYIGGTSSLGGPPAETPDAAIAGAIAIGILSASDAADLMAVEERMAEDVLPDRLAEAILAWIAGDGPDPWESVALCTSCGLERPPLIGGRCAECRAEAVAP